MFLQIAIHLAQQCTGAVKRDGTQKNHARNVLSFSTPLGLPLTPLVIPPPMSGRPPWGGGGGHHTMVALKLQQFQYNLKKILLRRLVVPTLSCQSDVSPYGGGRLQEGVVLWTAIRAHWVPRCSHKFQLVKRPPAPPPRANGVIFCNFGSRCHYYCTPLSPDQKPPCSSRGSACWRAQWDDESSEGLLPGFKPPPPYLLHPRYEKSRKAGMRSHGVQGSYAPNPSQWGSGLIRIPSPLVLLKGQVVTFSLALR